MRLQRGTPSQVEDGRIPGLWFPLLLGDVHGRRYSATLNCPGCGKRGTLEDHEIKADGTASPDISCPHGCGYEGPVVLADWPPEWSVVEPARHGDFAAHDAALIQSLQVTQAAAR